MARPAGVFGLRTWVFLCSFCMYISGAICSVTTTALVAAKFGYPEFNVMTSVGTGIIVYGLSMGAMSFLNNVPPQKVADFLTAINQSFNIFNFVFVIGSVYLEASLVHGPWSTGPTGFVAYTVTKMSFLILYARTTDAQRMIRTFSLVIAGQSAVSFARDDHNAGYAYAWSSAIALGLHAILAHGYGALKLDPVENANVEDV